MKQLIAYASGNHDNPFEPEYFAAAGSAAFYEPTIVRSSKETSPKHLTCPIHYHTDTGHDARHDAGHDARHHTGHNPGAKRGKTPDRTRGKTPERTQT